MPTISEITGLPVDTSSEEWRHECECRWVLDHFATKEDRRVWLYGHPEGVHDAMGRVDESRIGKKSIAGKRGLAAADRIREGGMAIAEARRSARAAK